MDDIEIIREVQAGNTEFFSLLVEKYHRHLLNFIYRLVRDEQVVEDIGQDVFMSIYRSIRTFRTRGGVPFSAWLFITARNRCISELRKKKRAVMCPEDSAYLKVDGRTPEITAGENEELLAITAALEQLPEPYKSTILQSLAGDSPEEIAKTNRISAGTVKSRLFRARERLRLLLRARTGANEYERL